MITVWNVARTEGKVLPVCGMYRRRCVEAVAVDVEALVLHSCPDALQCSLAATILRWFTQLQDISWVFLQMTCGLRSLFLISTAVYVKEQLSVMLTQAGIHFDCSPSGIYQGRSIGNKRADRPIL